MQHRGHFHVPLASTGRFMLLILDVGAVWVFAVTCENSASGSVGSFQPIVCVCSLYRCTFTSTC